MSGASAGQAVFQYFKKRRIFSIFEMMIIDFSFKILFNQNTKPTSKGNIRLKIS